MWDAFFRIIEVVKKYGIGYVLITLLIIILLAFVFTSFTYINKNIDKFQIFKAQTSMTINMVS